MIQRIQTVFLLLVIVALGLFLWFPLIGLESPAFRDTFQGWRVGHTVEIWDGPYIIFFNAIFIGTAIGFTLLTIFLFKKRNFQILLCWFSIILIASGELFVYYQYRTRIFNGDVILTPWNLLAIIAVVLQFLAIIYIRKDEKLLQSVDRLR